MKRAGWDPRVRHRCEIFGLQIAILSAVMSRRKKRVITSRSVGSEITNPESLRRGARVPEMRGGYERGESNGPMR